MCFRPDLGREDEPLVTLRGDFVAFFDIRRKADIGQEDPRFADDPGRMANIDDLVAVLSRIFKRRPSSDWLQRLERAGVPAGPVLDIAGMQADPQALARGMVTEAPHRRLGPVKTLGHPVHYSATPAEISRGAPLLGEHTLELLGEHGYSPAEAAKFVAEGTVVAENS